MALVDLVQIGIGLVALGFRAKGQLRPEGDSTVLPKEPSKPVAVVETKVTPVIPSAPPAITETVRESPPPATGKPFELPPGSILPRGITPFHLGDDAGEFVGWIFGGPRP